MSVVVFAGPTVPVEAIRLRLDARIEPPAAAGDVLRAARGAPRVIALIDGVFDRALPVWHKEILWAMSQGIHVFGAASMGALRAAELHQFGMRGIGRIFVAYRDGTLEADDEVAVLHAPAEIGFTAVTEALVNMRATLQRANADHILDDDETSTFVELARALHYSERTWETLLANATTLLPSPAGRLRRWLPSGRIDLKRDDAIELLDEVATFTASDPAPMQVDYRLAWTDAWEALYARSTDGDAAAGVLDELRLQADRFRSVRRAALLRSLATSGAKQSKMVPKTAAGESLRARLGLWRAAQFDRWLVDHDLDRLGFTALAEEEAALDRLERATDAALRHAMLSELRANGDYLQLAQRAQQKAARLAAAGLDSVRAGEVGIDVAPILGSLARQVDLPPNELVRYLGFADPTALEQAILREHLFTRMIKQDVMDATVTARPDST